VRKENADIIYDGQFSVSTLTSISPHLQSKMREVISLHVGQAGVQIGNACCE